MMFKRKIQKLLSSVLIMVLFCTLFYASFNLKIEAAVQATYYVATDGNDNNSGTNIKVYVDDMETPLINTSDSTWTTGLIGVRAYNSTAKFDNIDVK